MKQRFQGFIVDMDTHMSPYKNFDKSIDKRQWELEMAKAGIDKAVAWLLPQEVEDVSESNAYIYEASLKNPRIIPFGWVNIREGLEKAKQDVRTCLIEYGFKGVKLNGAQNEYHIDCEEALEVIQLISDLGGMVAFHIGADYPEYTSPKRAQSVAKKFPHMPILMVHMGGAGEPDVSSEVIEAAKDNPNMHLIGSAISVNKVKNAIDVLGASRVMFGSDTPFASAGDIRKQYEEMLTFYNEETKEKVFGLNAKKLFGL